MKNHNNLIKLIKDRMIQNDKSPLYVRVAESIKLAIKQQILFSGEYLPTERELSDLIGVSRITIRKAFDVLEESDVIIRSRGSGTMIKDTMEYSLKEVKGFSQQVMLNGKKPDTFWIKKDIIPCTQVIAEQLDIKVNDNVFLLKRIRYVDDQPVSIEESYVPENLIQDPDDIQMSLYDYFQIQNIIPCRTSSKVSTQLPTENFLKDLSLNSNIPVLIIKQVAFDKNNLPIEFSINYCRGDMYVFVTSE